MSRHNFRFRCSLTLDDQLFFRSSREKPRIFGKPVRRLANWFNPEFGLLLLVAQTQEDVETNTTNLMTERAGIEHLESLLSHGDIIAG